MPKEHERIVKSTPAFITNTDEAQGIVEAIVNVFGVLDSQDDIIHPGAYTKTLNERGNQIKVRVLDNHNNHSILDVIGKALDTHEVGRDGLPPEVLSKYPEATGGLYTKTQFLMDTPEGLGAFKRLAAGAVDEWSIALDVMQQDYSREKTSDGKTVAARNIRQLMLFEYSPVIWGANPATAVVGLKAASGKTDLPLADRERAWDASAAEKTVRDWAASGDSTDWDKYGQAFFWVDESNPEQFGSYKLPFAEVIDGKLTAVPRGIFAAAGAIQGARG